MALDDSSARGGARTGWGWRHLWSGLGLLLLLFWFPFYAFVSLVAPAWAVIPALLVWFGFLALAIRWFRPHPVRTFFVGAGAIVLWHAVGLTLDALGWAA